MRGGEKLMIDENQKIAKSEVLRQLAGIDEMVKNRVIDEHEAARLKDKIDPDGIGLRNKLATQ